MFFSNAIISSIGLHAIQRVVYFPIWWYSIGIKKRLIGFIQSTKALFHNLAIMIMLKYLFKPMFGERSRSGRIISFFMRLLLLFWRLFLFLFLTSLKIVLVILWIILPVIALWQLISLLFY